jgi:hypothetical protein
MNKFEKPTDEEYLTVCNAITGIIDTIPSLAISKRGPQHDTPQEPAPITLKRKKDVSSDLSYIDS